MSPATGYSLPLSLSLSLSSSFFYLAPSLSSIFENTDYTMDVKENGDPYICRVTYSNFRIHGIHTNNFQ